MECLVSCCFDRIPHFLRVELALEAEVECQVDEAVMVETRDDPHEGSLELDLGQRVVLKQCLDVRLVGNLPWREEIISQESLAA